jgi:hypothetical protein
VLRCCSAAVIRFIESIGLLELIELLKVCVKNKHITLVELNKTP